MKIAFNPFHILETHIRARLKKKGDDDERATMMAIRMPLIQSVGADAARTLLIHPRCHEIYVRVRFEFTTSQIPAKAGSGDPKPPIPPSSPDISMN